MGAGMTTPPRRSTSRLSPCRSAGGHGDPMGDPLDMLVQLLNAEFDPRRVVHLSFAIRFDDRVRWESPFGVERPRSWHLSAYSLPGAHMILLSRVSALTVHTMGRHRRFVQSFAARFGGVWESMVVEDLHGADSWHQLADEQLRPAGGTADVPGQGRPQKRTGSAIA
jgi:hypothetical protein